jgi:hypothetical protein
MNACRCLTWLIVSYFEEWKFVPTAMRQLWRAPEPNVTEPTRAIVWAAGILGPHEQTAFHVSSLQCLAN